MDTGSISDGYHTFDELYDHRITLFLALCRHIIFKPRWKALKHADGSSIDGWFIVGIGMEPGEQITYHVPLLRWPEAAFLQELDHAPPWDGHTAQDVLDRLKKL